MYFKELLQTLITFPFFVTYTSTEPAIALGTVYRRSHYSLYTPQYVIEGRKLVLQSVLNYNEGKRKLL